ncbi:hypothetical protein EDC19_2583 [Natranaerovirga hydrolytica]|uniref:Uncharacterized protein n=1 Tax=Natranaerovirga hydrolytica TaxID=680378 RepID=A0A4R1M6P6_9FIRM|nr:hypothetical protein [Natranaerovirga hydrolytica]TCK87936.1 hypothetical protein EDC19_2583 [Natranaerovirga hydrolytica]
MSNFRIKNSKKTYNVEIYCNKCGDLIAKDSSFPKADYLTIEKNWGYFSNKDNENHTVHLCEHCYDEFVRSFAVAPIIKKRNVCI